MAPGKGQMTPLVPPPKRPPAAGGSPGPPCAPAGAAGPVPPQGRGKKSSRRHQRFQERRALLERRGLLRPRRRQAARAGPETPLHGRERGLPGAEAARAPRRPRPAKYVAIDCEMVGTGPRGQRSELARCSVVGYDGHVVYDKYVRPQLPVVDYRTRWSGVTRRHLKGAIPFRAARAEILKILKDKIVVGHAIHNDFQALKYFHPKERTRDTSCIPLLNQKAGIPVKANASLKSLAKHLLHKNIQVGCKGHSSVEDAQTTMELYRLVEVEWEEELASSLPPRPPSPPSPVADSAQYMDDRYWPADLNVDNL